MTVFVRYFNLDVGQGTGIFVEVIDTTKGDVPQHAILVDLGSEKEHGTAGVASAIFVANRLNLMSPQPTLDAVILSHSDKDHINLMPDLLKYFAPYNPLTPGPGTLRVLDCIYGGDWAKYEKDKLDHVLQSLAPYLLYNPAPTIWPRSVACNTTGLNTTPPVPLTKAGPVDVFLIIGNAPNQSTNPGAVPVYTDGFGINTLSFVLLIQAFGVVQFVATGDATGATLVWCNYVLNGLGGSVHLHTVLNVSAPHHGSAKTTFDIGHADASGTLTGPAVLNAFATTINAHTVVASAAFRASWWHPSATVLRYFWQAPAAALGPFWPDPILNSAHFQSPYILQNEFNRINSAGYVVNFPPNPDWYTIQAKLGVYTTTYYAADKNSHRMVVCPPNPVVSQDPPAAKLDPVNGPIPPLGVAWYFGADPTTVSIHQQPNRDNLHLAEVAGFASIGEQTGEPAARPTYFRALMPGECDPAQRWQGADDPAELVRIEQERADGRRRAGEERAAAPYVRPLPRPRAAEPARPALPRLGVRP